MAEADCVLAAAPALERADEEEETGVDEKSVGDGDNSEVMIVSSALNGVLEATSSVTDAEDDGTGESELRDGPFAVDVAAACLVEATETPVPTGTF